MPSSREGCGSPVGTFAEGKSSDRRGSGDKGTTRLGMVDGADTPPAFRRTKQPADVLRLPVNVLFGLFLFDLHLDDREQRLEKALPPVFVHVQRAAAHMVVEQQAVGHEANTPDSMFG